MTKPSIMVMGLALSMSAYAAETPEVDLTEVPVEVEQVVEGQAQQLGFDLQTPQGRRKFGDHMRKQREERARKLGFDLKTAKGQESWNKHMDQELEKVAKEKGFNLAEGPGREGAVQELMKRGDLAVVPMDRQGYERHGWKFQPHPIDLKMLPIEAQPLMAEKAAELGIDVTTPKGQQEFAEKMYTERKDAAQKMGFNIETPEGKQKFEQHQETEFKKLASDKKVKLNTPKGRETVMKEMAKQGKFAMLPQQPERFQQMGFDVPRMGRAGEMARNPSDRRMAKGDNRRENRNARGNFEKGPRGPEHQQMNMPGQHNGPGAQQGGPQGGARQGPPQGGQQRPPAPGGH
ncbi:MAG: hypothetical protein AB7F86_02275 [Bdellovibrionales bacterium]